MDGRGEPWPVKRPGFHTQMIHPKMFHKAPPFQVPVMQQHNVFHKSGPNTQMIMHHQPNMVHIQPTMSPKYQEMGAPVPQIVVQGGPKYLQMHPPMTVSPRAARPHMQVPEHGQGHPQEPIHKGASPAAMSGPQRIYKRAMQGPPTHIMKVTSSQMAPVYMGAPMHKAGNPPMSHNLSPRSMGGKHPSPGGNVNTNLSPKNYRHSGPMMPHPGSAQIPPHGLPIGMKASPQHMMQGGMNYSQMRPGVKAHMPMHGKGMGMSVSKAPMPKGSHHQGKALSPTMLHKQAMPGHAASHSPRMESMPKSYQPLPQRFNQVKAHAQATQSSPGGTPPAMYRSPQINPSEATELVRKELNNTDIKIRMRSAMIALLKDQLSKADSLYGKTFVLSDENRIVDALIMGFLPILQRLWVEAKKAHVYSLDDLYIALSAGGSVVKNELIVRRDIDPLEEFYRCKEDLENLLESYRTTNKQAPKDPLANSSSEEKEVTPLMKAQEYADVGYNQRQLLQKVTAVDYRNALWSNECIKMLPESFRIQQIKMISSLHFDIQTPPQSVSPPGETVHDGAPPGHDLLKGANTTETTNFSSVASKLLEKQGSNFLGKMPELPMLKLDMRYTKMPQVIPTQEMLMQISGYNQPPVGMPMMFPKGMNYPMMPIPKMIPLRSKGPPPQMPHKNPRPKAEGEPGPLLPGPMIMKKPPGMYGGKFKQPMP